MDVKVKRELSVDDFFAEMGDMGRLQKRSVFLLCLVFFAGTYPNLIGYFLAQNPAWRCAHNSTTCKLTGDIDTSHAEYKNRCLMPREDWQFTKPRDYSIVTEWELICDKETYPVLAKSAMFIGWIPGALLFGELSARYGRKRLMYVSVAGFVTIGFASSFSPGFWTFFAERLLIGFFKGGAVLTGYILATENVGQQHRSLTGNMTWIAFTVALCVLGLQAYLVREWRVLSVICSAPYILIVLTYRILPESVPWLHAKGKQEEAEQLLRKMAKANQRFPKDATLKKPLEDTSKKLSYWHLISRKSTALSTLLQFQGWVINTIVYYGITLASDQLGGDMYRDFVLSSLVEFPANISCIYLLRLGRRKTTVVSMLLAGCSCVVVAFIPTTNSGLTWTRVGVALFGKFCITLSFASIYLWSTELYSTQLRSRGMSVMQIAGRLGSAGAPWVGQFLTRVHPKLPFLIMGGLACLSALLCLGLKETMKPTTADKNEIKPLEVYANENPEHTTKF